MTVITQRFNLPSHSPKTLYPVVGVKKNGVYVYDVSGFSVKRSRSNFTSSFNINFIGITHFNDLDPLLDDTFEIYTGYNGNLNLLISGTPDSRAITHSATSLITNATFLDGMRKVMPPKVGKVRVDITPSFNEDGTCKNTKLKMSEVVGDILSTYNVNYYFSGNDYYILEYRANDYPMTVVKDLIEFSGNFLRYDCNNNCLYILSRFSNFGKSYDFIYTDYGDIIELSVDDNASGFLNAIKVFGVYPDRYNDADRVDGDLCSGYSWETEEDLHYIDDVVGMEKAPSSGYIDKPPTEKIKKKFYNVWLGFDIDPSSIKVEGGSWNEKTQKYEGAELVGYGTFYPSDEITIKDINTKAVKKDKEYLSPGEGMISTPWNYEENSDSDSKDFTLADGAYTYMNLFGKVLDGLDKLPIDQAIVQLDYTFENNIFQWWKFVGEKGRSTYEFVESDFKSTHNVEILFYMPEGMVEGILGNLWQRVPDEEHVIPATPETIPAYTLSKSGATDDAENQKGLFTFSNVPISFYTVTASKLGYDDGELLAEIDKSAFDFLTSLPDNNKTKKYKLIDTKYNVNVYGKRKPPISFSDAPVDYSSDVTVEKDGLIAIDCRSSAGITMAGGLLIHGQEITDGRIADEDGAVSASQAIIFDAIASGKSKKFKLPHNPYLKIGNAIQISSQCLSWSNKTFVVDSIETAYEVNDGEESIFDIVEAWEYVY